MKYDLKVTCDGEFTLVPHRFHVRNRVFSVDEYEDFIFVLAHPFEHLWFYVQDVSLEFVWRLYGDEWLTESTYRALEKVLDC